MKVRLLLTLAVPLLLAPAVSACGGDDTEAAPPPTTPAVSGAVRVDGSSTVAPFTQQAADLFRDTNPRTRVSVGVSTTGDGFERFCAGRTDIANASRPIHEEERRACRAEGIDYVELLIANDALTVVTSSKNDWAECLTTEQLRRIWQPGSKIERWSQVDPRFPDTRIELFGPDRESGTFDFFTTAINGAQGASRSDYKASKDDSVIVRNVAAREGSLGYLGFPSFEDNAEILTPLEVDGGEGCVSPGIRAVQQRTYRPLSRPLFAYVSTASLERPVVKEFVRSLVAEAQLFAIVGHLIPLTDGQLAQAQRAFRRAAA